MIYNIHRIWTQVALLKTLCHQPASMNWARESIKVATQEIEKAAPDDVAAEFAQNVRLELAQIPQERADVRLIETGVGEAVEVLAHYVAVIGTTQEDFQKPMRGA